MKEVEASGTPIRYAVSPFSEKQKSKRVVTGTLPAGTPSCSCCLLRSEPPTNPIATCCRRWERRASISGEAPYSKREEVSLNSALNETVVRRKLTRRAGVKVSSTSNRTIVFLIGRSSRGEMTAGITPGAAMFGNKVGGNSKSIEQQLESQTVKERGVEEEELISTASSEGQVCLMFLNLCTNSSDKAPPRV